MSNVGVSERKTADSPNASTQTKLEAVLIIIDENKYSPNLDTQSISARILKGDEAMTDNLDLRRVMFLKEDLF